MDERALVEALATASIAGAALDVYEREPEVSEGLLALENVVLDAAPRQRDARHADRDGHALRRGAARRPPGRAAAGERRRVACRAVSGYGSASMWGDLRRVLVRRPLPEDAAAWEAYGWRAAPDVAAAQAEHEALCALLEEAGAEVVVSEHDRGNPDAIYTYDATLVGSEGAVLLLPGKEGRRREPEATATRSRTPGCRSSARRAPGHRRGRGHRLARRADAPRRDRLPHEPRGGEALSTLFPGVEVIVLDLPHWNGAREVMHLMSFISPLDRDLALVYTRIAPTRLMWLLVERGIEIVEVPDEEFETQGPNVLALGPRSRSRSRATTRHAAGWSERGSTSSRTAATRSHARATAGRPA